MPQKKHVTSGTHKLSNDQLATRAITTNKTSSRPSWPVLESTIPAEDLFITNFCPGQIVTISNLLSAAACRKYVNFLSSLPLTTTPGNPQKGHALRVNDRFQVEDADFAQRLWSGTALKQLVLAEADQTLWDGKVLGLNSNIRIYRYRKGQFFAQHYDDSNNVSWKPSVDAPSVSARTTWTLLIYLTAQSTGCIGGETVFFPEPALKKKKNAPPPEPIVVDLEVGMALLHRHGKDCMLHEGRKVLDGEKWVIRSDLCVER